MTSAEGPARHSRAPLARGIALFFGAFSLANAAGVLRDGLASQDVWWIDLHFLPAPAAALLAAAGAVLMFAWGFAPDAAPWRRRATAATVALLAGAAVVNAVTFYLAWRAGGFVPAVPVPFSLVVALALAWLARVIAAGGVPPARTRGKRLAVVAAFAALVVAFPIAQTLFYGTTDYRRPADAAVVFGAMVHPGGVLSTSLEDRVRTAVDLYHAGLAPRLIMSGGVGDSGYDEAVMMRARAIELGVPASAIVIDSLGVDTDATVANTSAMFERDGTSRVLVVSQFYHLPRIKLAYRAAGRDVWTVPASASRYIVQTPGLVLREVGGFWTYWGRALLRG